MLDYAPIIGADRARLFIHTKGDYWTEIFHLAMAVSDVFIVNAAAVAKVAVKASVPVISHLGGAGLTNAQLVSKAAIKA